MKRKEFELTDEQFEAIIDACKPVPAMAYSTPTGPQPMFRSPQENANDAWKRLGEELGFVWDTVKPSSKGQRFFTAEVAP